MRVSVTSYALFVCLLFSFCLFNHTFSDLPLFLCLDCFGVVSLSKTFTSITTQQNTTEDNVKIHTTFPNHTRRGGDSNAVGPFLTNSGTLSTDFLFLALVLLKTLFLLKAPTRMHTLYTQTYRILAKLQYCGPVVAGLTTWSFMETPEIQDGRRGYSYVSLSLFFTLLAHFCSESAAFWMTE